MKEKIIQLQLKTKIKENNFKYFIYIHCNLSFLLN